MLTTIHFLKKSWIGRYMVIGACVLPLVGGTPRKAQGASMVEYALLLSSNAFHQATVELDTAASSAYDARLNGDTVGEIAGLSAAAGAAQALLGITDRCTSCADVRSTIQQVVDLTSLMLEDTGSGSCNPNAVACF